MNDSSEISSKYLSSTAVILLSGGQDSVTCLLWAIKQFSSVSAILFSYQQRHTVEIQQAEWIANYFQIPYQIVPVTIAAKQNSLTNLQQPISQDQNLPYPTTFVPGRNLLFLTLAASWAMELNSSQIIIGANQADYSGYPDCRKEFLVSA
ncbi:MAG: 7-cyano-7-deazaguanine synthase, partial [Bacteroidia bacterium]|nr:7-cyano-7-deazaguanine synthase [Bacteroidia bacterium]